MTETKKQENATEKLVFKDDAPDEVPKAPAAVPGEGGSAEGGEGKGFWDSLKEKMESGIDENDKGLKKAAHKISIKLGKVGLLFGEGEQFVYNYFKLNKLMTTDEISAEKNELAEDINILIETRIKVFSKFGDMINVLIDVLSHIAVRASRFYGMPKEQQSALVNEAMGGVTPSSGLDPKIEAYARQLHITYENAKDLYEQGVFK